MQAAKPTPFRILYICTHNRCRSILAEALTNHLYGAQLDARSAGSQPSGAVHPEALLQLQALGIDTTHLHSKNWDDLQQFAPDLVITLCDQAAGESCPVWFGDSLKIHWPLTDPSAMQGTTRQNEQAFAQCLQTLSHRAGLMAGLVSEQLDPDELVDRIQQQVLLAGTNS